MTLSPTLGGAVHVAVLFDNRVAVAIPMWRVSTWKNAIGAMNRCVVFIHGAHSKKRP